MNQKIGHGYNFKEELPLSELSQFKDHRRLTVFFHKGTTCAREGCDRVGTRLICGQDRGGRLHWDVYTEDLVLMTVDHVMPKSLGGGEELSNKVPMCTNCNARKGNTLEPNAVADPVLKAIIEMKNHSNKVQSLLKNTINTKKFNAINKSHEEYGKYLEKAVQTAIAHDNNTRKLLESFIKLSIEKGVFTLEEFESSLV